MTFISRPLSLNLIIFSFWMHAVYLLTMPAVAFPQAVPEYADDSLAHYEFLRINRVYGTERIALQDDIYEFTKDNPAQLTFEKDWARYKDERPRQRHFLRSVGEISLLLLGGSIWYWSDQDFNRVDWDLDPTPESLWKKITGEAVRFDTNTIYTNIFNHPFTGSGYYTAARSNGYTFLESFLFTLAASSFWEYLLEYLEQVSINDQVFSTVGGTVIGEIVYQLGEFSTASADNTANSILKWAFGGFQNYHRWRDGIPAKRAGSVDRFGFRDDIWHQFDLFSGFGTAADNVIAEIGVDTQIIGLPGYGTRAGEVSTFIDETVFTHLNVRASFGEDGLQDVSLFTKVMFLGYFRQHLTRLSNGTLSGYSMFIGPASGYELNRHDWSETGIEDVYGVINIVGPSMDLAYYHNALRMRLTMDLYGDFAAIQAFALDAFKAVGSVEFAKAVLRDQGYYYALGLTVRTQATLTYDQLEAGVRGRYSYYDSIEDLNRFEDDITNDVVTTDEVASVRMWVAYNIMNDFMKIGFSYEKRWRSGTASDGSVEASESETEDRILGSLHFLF